MYSRAGDFPARSHPSILSLCYPDLSGFLSVIQAGDREGLPVFSGKDHADASRPFPVHSWTDQVPKNSLADILDLKPSQ